MVHWCEVMQFARRTYNFVDPGIAKLDNFPCFNINQMIVLSALVCSFKLGNILSELMLYNQIAIEQ